MTRWKREPTVALRTMYAHNQYSRWHGYVLEAASQLGLMVGVAVYANHYDASRTTDWYVLESQLAAVGGKRAVHDLAHDLADQGRRDYGDE